jgi:hypothetical protein
MAIFKPPITCVSVIICDDIFKDQMSGKIAIWGSFNNIVTSKLPATHPRMSIFVTITNGRGQRNLAVCIENARTSESIVEISGPMQFRSPLDIIDLVIGLHRVNFSEYGKYWVAVKEDGRLLAQRPFMVMKKPKKRKGKNDDSQSSI